MKRIFLPVLGIAVLLGFLAPLCAVAQETASAPSSLPSSATEIPEEEIPEEYLQEAETFRLSCEGNPNMADYYNCHCLALNYLDDRVQAGPKKDKSAIMMDIAGTCGDATGAAGGTYQECLGLAPILPAGIKPEEYCSCVGNTYAKLYRLYGLQPGSKTFIRVKTEAMVQCRDPALAEKLYR